MNRLYAVLLAAVVFLVFHSLSRGIFKFGQLDGARVEQKPEACSCKNANATTNNDIDNSVEDIWWSTYYNSTISTRSDAFDWKAASKRRWNMKHCSLPPLDKSDWKPEDEHRPGQLVIVYQYGKCGSTAMLNHLDHHLKGTQVVHAHVWDKKIHASIQTRMERNETVWIVTMVRNRFVRDISALFQNYKRLNVKANTEMQRLVSKTQHYSFMGGGASQHWFTDDFLKETDVDMLQHASEFNFSRRSLLVASGLYRILLLRYEDVADWAPVLHHYFPSLPKDSLARARIKPDTWLDKRYNQLLTVMPYQPAEIGVMLAGDTARFYTECELQAMARGAAEPLPAAWVW